MDVRAGPQGSVELCPCPALGSSLDSGSRQGVGNAPNQELQSRRQEEDLVIDSWC